MNFQEQYQLQPLNTFNIACTSQYFVNCDSVEDIEAVINSSIFKTSKHIVLGGGSNVLFTQNFDGIIIKNTILGIETVEENDETIILKVGAGEEWHPFVSYCVQHNYGGIENLSLIPGCIGASPIQNIGAYGVELSNVLVCVEGINLITNLRQTLSKEDCKLGYRDSIFKNDLKNKFIITAVYLKLQKKPIVNISYGDVAKHLSHISENDITIKDVSDAIVAIRQAKLPNPKEFGNAGSFFKNVVVSGHVFNLVQQNHPAIPHYITQEGVKIPTAWLIEQCGFKGLQEGNVGCYKTQPLVIVNYGGATGEEVFNYSTKLIEAVKAKFGIELEREVNVV